MPQTVRAVVAVSKGDPIEIVIPDPGPLEVVVKIETCGVCHTDLHYRDGGINDEFPFLLGHEATGRVETVGASVKKVAPGDYVVLAWRASCGECRACRRGRHHQFRQSPPGLGHDTNRRHTAVARSRHPTAVARQAAAG